MRRSKSAFPLGEQPVIKAAARIRIQKGTRPRLVIKPPSPAAQDDSFLKRARESRFGVSAGKNCPVLPSGLARKLHEGSVQVPLGSAGRFSVNGVSNEIDAEIGPEVAPDILLAP